MFSKITFNLPVDDRHFGATTKLPKNTLGPCALPTSNQWFFFFNKFCHSFFDKKEMENFGIFSLCCVCKI
jgi:hypothetical protein